MTRQAYRRVFELLRQQIFSGELKPGDRLPSERELSISFGVSRITTRHALRLLEEEGLLERHPGKGTFVRVPRPRKLPVLNCDFAGSLRRTAPNVDRVLLCHQKMVPPAHVAELLGLLRTESVLAAERLDKLNGERLAFDRAYIPLAHASRIDEVLLGRIDFLELWLDREGLVMSHALEGIEAVGADAECVERLGVELGTPMLLTRDTIYEMNGRPIAVFESIYRGDRFKLVSTLERSPGHASTRH